MAAKARVFSEITYQRVESFGVSGAWWAQLVGSWEGNPARAEIARLLFSKTEGLGIACYRYNLGGGSKRSRKGRFNNEPRRADSFDVSETEYDWERDGEAVWMLREAVRLGVEEVVFFVNSPPERWTVTGTTQAKLPFRKNLRRACEPAFTRYVLDVTEHFLREGIPIKFVSPVNEPFGPWIEKSGQEGCHYHPAGLRRLLRGFALAMAKRPALRDVLLSGAENNDLRLMNKTYTRALLDDRLIRKYMDGIDVHGYVFHPLRFLDEAGVRRRFRKYMDKRYPGQPIRMTEWTHMQGGRDYGMGSALAQAHTMFMDFSILNVVSWQCWIAVSEVDFCDGLLYIDAEKQVYSIPKRYYAFGNFTKFLPRGSLRVGLELQNAPAGLEYLAFQVPDGKTVLLFANHSAAPCDVTVAPGKGTLHVTSEEKDLSWETIDLEAFALPARSVCTLVIEHIFEGEQP
ncbi:MAG: hypothetical protein LBC83_02540 [Oscillospiraceae bacterium]|jgi:O-glycosyl hydrolase|nr:hypothetical protein [Oscillospiraceae bacterium]